MESKIIIKLGKYTITKEDPSNFGLYETKAKGVFKGVQKEGTSEKLIGYYGYLSMAMSKIVNSELLNASDEYLDASSILNALRELETKLDNAYGIRPDGIEVKDGN